MTLKVAATVVCDVCRARGCHLQYTAAVDSAPASIFAVRKEAEGCGWTKEAVWGRLVDRDACPACAAARAQQGAPPQPGLGKVAP